MAGVSGTVLARKLLIFRIMLQFILNPGRLTKGFPLLAAAVMVFSGGAKAQVVSSGSSTFLDENTGLTWVKVDTFWDQTYDQILASLPANEEFATLSQVEQLFTDAGSPTSQAAYTSLAEIMGGAYAGGPEPQNRQIIWGDYASGATENWAWTYGPDANWLHSGSTGSDATYAAPDLGAWIVTIAPASVPDVTSPLLLLALGLGGLLVLARRTRLGVRFGLMGN